MPNSGLPLSDKEMEMVKKIAAQEGRDQEEIATELVQQALARRVRKRTGKGPAKVYSIRGRK